MLIRGTTTPKELVAIAPGEPVLKEYEEPLLRPNQVRIKSRFSAEKHGTTLSIYRNLSPFTEKTFDPKLGFFIPRGTGEGWASSFPMKLGNMTVGIITEIGTEVRKFKIGDRVYGYLTTIVPVSWYHGEARGLYLGEEWHFNRQVMVSGARVESEPYRDYPLWDRKRVYETVLQLFRRKVLTVKGMVHPIVQFEKAAEAYRMLDERTEETIKLGVVYS